MARITFLPSGRVVDAEPGVTLLEAARSEGVVLVASCAGRGTCGSCGVSVVEGDLAPPDEVELQGLSRASAGVRLACRARVVHDVSVRPIVAPTRPHARRVAGPAVDVCVGVDLGTTNVAALAVAEDGGEVGSAGVSNAQAPWGSDVLARISVAMSGEGDSLRRAAEQSVSEAVLGAVPEPGRVRRIVVSANTAMAVLLAGADPLSLAVAPHEAPSSALGLPAESSLWREFPDAEIVLVPPLVSFVGGDVLAGALHAGLLYATEPSMLVDIGTNAEIVLAVGDRLLATSAAAGPAFEGGGVACGGPPVQGAVVSVRIGEDGGVELRTIGDAAPRWFAGSGLLSAVWALRRLGHLDADGRLRSHGPLEHAFGVDARGVVVVALGGEGRLEISQLDVRALQLAKAAVLAGVRTVLDAAGLEPDSLSDLSVAGAFGGAVPADVLVGLGVVPSVLEGALRFVGNASLLGAAEMALDPQAMMDAGARAARVEHVELASTASFSRILMEAMRLERV